MEKAIEVKVLSCRPATKKEIRDLARATECRICKKDTNQQFNIDLERTPICYRCESSIVMQSIGEKYNIF